MALGHLFERLLGEIDDSKRAGRMATAEELQAMQQSRDMKKGGKVSSASKRADGIATKGKTKGRIV